MSALQQFYTRLLAIGLALLVMAVLGCLGGCGGGDAELDHDVPTPRVDCQALPEACR